MNFTKQDFEYLRPPKEVFDVKHADDYISRGEGNQSLRRIFNGVPFTPFEQEKLAGFKKLVQEQKLKLPEKWSEADYMRYVYSGRFNMERCIENLKTHIEWRADPKRGTLTEKAASMLKDGLIYISGRDKQFRPIIVINVYKYDMKKMDIEDFIMALAFVLDVAINYYFVPGKVENWILIVETNAISLFNFPFQIFKRLMQVTGANYPCTSEKMFVTNPSRLFNASWNIAKGMLDSVTAAKVAVLPKNQFNEFFQYIAPEQLEAKYGGKLADPVTYWPPVNTLNKTPYTQDKDYNQNKNKMNSIDLLGKGKNSQIVPQEQNSNENELNDSIETVYYDFEVPIWSWPDIDDEEDNHRTNKYMQKRYQDVSKQGHYSIFASPQLNPKLRKRTVDDSLDRSDSSIASEHVAENNDKFVSAASVKRSVTFGGGPQVKPTRTKISTFVK